MADLFRKAQVAVSLSTHDGTPNTLLEAMACGCFPVAGDLESVREWIEPGVNGLLVDPGDAAAAAKAIVEGLQRPKLRQSALEMNVRMVRERAEYGRVMLEAEGFFRELRAA
jgi:glycosyltransferase involved in cell wall biosynthesis